jgi:putative hydrolase of the HAD superfamily
MTPPEPSDGASQPSGGLQALVVDFGGVLTTPLQDAMNDFAISEGIELQDLLRVALAAYHGDDDQLVMDFEMGKLSDADFSEQFAARLTEASGKEVRAEGLVDRLLGTLGLEESMLTAVARSREAGLKTALLSNSWGLGGYPRDRIDDLFDVIVISGEVGMRKPNLDIFELTTEKLGLPGAACVFVDDHGGHLKTAAEHGMKTILHREPEATISELEELLGVPLR